MKVNWNWGTKLVIAMGLFMAMIVAFVVVMVKQEVSLVEPDYYPKGQAFQQMITSTENTVAYAGQITAQADREAIRVKFPEFFRPGAVEGNMHVYNRVSDRGDRHANFTLDSTGTLIYPAEGLSGRYILKLNWTQDNVGYYTEKSVTIQ